MTKINCFLDKCIYCKDYVCTKDEITLDEEHMCYGGCDEGWAFQKDPDEDDDKMVWVRELPECCDKCFALDDNGDYPTCLITHIAHGYNFRIRDKRMPECPLGEMITCEECAKIGTIDCDFYVRGDHPRNNGFCHKAVRLESV